MCIEKEIVSKKLSFSASCMLTKMFVMQCFCEAERLVSRDRQILFKFKIIVKSQVDNNGPGNPVTER